MVHLLAIIALVFAVIFYAWSLGHGVWDYRMFTLVGLALWCIAGHPKVP